MLTSAEADAEEAEAWVSPLEAVTGAAPSQSCRVQEVREMRRLYLHAWGQGGRAHADTHVYTESVNQLGVSVFARRGTSVLGVTLAHGRWLARAVKVLTQVA